MSLFIGPDRAQIDAAVEVGAPVIEIHTGHYADLEDRHARQLEFERIVAAAKHATAAGLCVNAGHGLNYQNVGVIAAIPQLRELNIGHAIIARALFTGLQPAVREMKRLMLEARRG